jgi:tetratricopeptide (TPR) repeat protein
VQGSLKSILSWTLPALLCIAAAQDLLHAGRAPDVRTEAFRLLNKGVSAYKKGNYAEAVEALEKSTSMALNGFRGYFYLGLALIGDRRYSDALEALAVAVDLDPGHLQSHVATGDAHLKLGDLPEAQASYFRALKLRPEYSAALDGLARVYEAEADEQQAVAFFRRAIASNRGYAPAYTHLGDLYLRNEQFKEAVELLEEAVSIRPDFAQGLNRLAQAYGQLGLENEAVAAIRKAIELEPLDASHHATLGWLELLVGFPDTAEEWFVKSLELDPALPEGHAGLAEVSRRRGEYQAALQTLDAALADLRLDTRTRLKLEEFREEVVNEQLEVAALYARIGAGEASAADYSALAELFAGRGEWDEAVELQRQAGSDYEQRARLAFMLFQANAFREAHSLYREMARERPSPELELNGGVCLALLGNDQGAVEAYRRTLELQPDNTLARLYLGNALLRMGQVDPAVDEYSTFLRRHSEGENAERVRRILSVLAPDAVPQSPALPVGPTPRAGDNEGPSP